MATGGRALVRSAASVAVLAALLSTGFTASLGGVATRTLRGLDAAGGAGTPTIIGCDSFTGTSGATLQGRAATDGAKCAGRTWTVHAGAWSISSGQAASSSAATANATLDTADPSATVSVTVSAINTGTRQGGIVTAHDGASTYLAAVAINGSPDRVELRLYTGGTPTAVASAAVTMTSANRLALSRAGTAVTVDLNGATVIATTLSAAQSAGLGAAGRNGLFGGTSTVRFDDLLVTDP